MILLRVSGMPPQLKVKDADNES
ncbi:hypothetical protein NTGBS_1080002 [Candidatus Nitrotoga sp. BS]|nr:hypothetical protein NTGBS_1080002 [Candidatus Nitrotoga sp. BS]